MKSQRATKIHIIEKFDKYNLINLIAISLWFSKHIL